MLIQTTGPFIVACMATYVLLKFLVRVTVRHHIWVGLDIYTVHLEQNQSSVLGG